MPSSLLTDMERGSNGPTLDDHRAIQLALELSMLGLDEETNFGENRAKKSMNMTECVQVPTSEHVAEIVGRQGCKIKALRAKTNTYIKTPVRGEEPVFVVTGRKEDVAMAQREILQAAEHFSQIRASRKNSASIGPTSLGPNSPTIPGHITKSVRVPYRVVGLVVGPKGATIKRIQQTTNTYIVTPSREKEPVFEVTGLPENVEKAKGEIEQHIALRTGGILEHNPSENGDVHLSNGFASPLFSPTGNTSFSAFLDHNHAPHNHQRSSSSDSYSGYYASSTDSSKFSDFGVKSPFANSGFFPNDIVPSPTAELDSPRSSAFDPAPGSPAPSMWPDFVGQRSALNRAVGSNSVHMSRLNSIPSMENSSDVEPLNLRQPPIRRMMSEPMKREILPGNPSRGSYSSFSPTDLINVSRNGEVVYSNGPLNGLSSPTVDVSASGSLSDGSSGSQASSPGASWRRGNMLDDALKRKLCHICKSSDVVAALVPCGHNLFCMECALKMRSESKECPACGRLVEQVIRIIPY